MWHHEKFGEEAGPLGSDLLSIDERLTVVCGHAKGDGMFLDVLLLLGC